MNIFYLDRNTRQCARDHNDRHLVKMIVESAQLLSAAHRLLDGTHSSIQVIGKNGKPRKKTVYTLPVKKRDALFYKATHVNHPCAKWVREGRDQYRYLASLLSELCHEYTRRYGKIHKCYRTGLVAELFAYPENLPLGRWTQPPQAMPDEFKRMDSIEAYREYYRKGKAHLAKWQGKMPRPEQPDWF